MSDALLTYDEAAAQIADYATRVRQISRAGERVELLAAAGRTLARPLCADRDQPEFPRSTRDGYACRAREASKNKPLRIAGTTRAGDPPPATLPSGAAWEIMTGAPVPEGADAVMMFEHVEAADGSVRLLPPRTLEPGENIVARAAQARAGDELLPIGTVLGAGQIALAASCGQSALEVYARPRVALLATGDELVPIDRDPAPGQIRNSSSPMLAAMVASAGGEPWLLPTAADTDAALDAALAEALRADLLLITGGVSAGKFDLVEPALARLGATFHFTGTRIQPGKPIVFAEIPRSKNTIVGAGAPGLDSETGVRNSLVPGPRSRFPVFGLPGNPISSAVTFLLFAAPVLAALAGRREPAPRFALARLSSAPARRPKGGLTRFLPARCTFGAQPGAMPEVALVPWQGSGDLAALARSNCFLVLPDDGSSLDTGDAVRILLP